MLTVKYDLNMDLALFRHQQSIRLHDLGSGACHLLHLCMYENGKAWIPPDDCGYKLSWKKNTGAKGSREVLVTADQQSITFEIPPEILVDCQEIILVLRMDKSGCSIGSFPVRLYICPCS